MLAEIVLKVARPVKAPLDSLSLCYFLTPGHGNFLPHPTFFDLNSTKNRLEISGAARNFSLTNCNRLIRNRTHCTSCKTHL